MLIFNILVPFYTAGCWLVSRAFLRRKCRKRCRGYDTATGKLFHAEQGTGRRFEKDQTLEWSGSAPAERGDTIRLTLDFESGTLAVAKNGTDLGVMCCGMTFRHWLWQAGGCVWAVEVWNSAVRVLP